MSTPADVSTPAPADAAASVVRVERGQADPEELAALTAILLARAGRSGDTPATGPTRSTARWRRLERTPGFRAPHSWQG